MKEEAEEAREEELGRAGLAPAAPGPGPLPPTREENLTRQNNGFPGIGVEDEDLGVDRLFLGHRL